MFTNRSSLSRTPIGLAVSAAILLSVSALGAMALPGEAIAKDIVLTGRGTATYKRKKDMMNAREDAIEGALVDAVRKGLQKFVSPEVLEENKDTVENELLPTAAALVKKYEIVNEKDRDKTYEVIVKARIDEEALQTNLTSLGISQDVGSRKSIAILIEEYATGDVAPSSEPVVSETIDIHTVDASHSHTIDANTQQDVRAGSRQKQDVRANSSASAHQKQDVRANSSANADYSRSDSASRSDSSEYSDQGEYDRKASAKGKYKESGKASGAASYSGSGGSGSARGSVKHKESGSFSGKSSASGSHDRSGSSSSAARSASSENASASQQASYSDQSSASASQKASYSDQSSASAFYRDNSSTSYDEDENSEYHELSMSVTKYLPPEALRQPRPDPVSAGKIGEFLLDRDVKLVDSGVLNKVRDGLVGADGVLINEIDNQTLSTRALELGSQHGFDAMMVGVAAITRVEGAEQNGNFAASATLSVRVVDCATGDIVAMTVSTQRGKGDSFNAAADNSARRLGTVLGGKLGNQLFDYWKKRKEKGIEVTIRLRASALSTRLKIALSDAISGVEGADNVEERSYDKANGIIEYTVTTRRNLTQFKNDMFRSMFNQPALENVEEQMSLGTNWNLVLE